MNESETPKPEVAHPKGQVAMREETIAAFWKENHIFEKSLKKESPKGEFVFYEGPPTANGRPGIHHLEARAFKDAIPRYKTMRGYRVPRRAGWDTHGLPVELEVEKQLGFSGKKQIETYGIAAFNAKCRESVFKYIDDWARFTHRIGYWVDQSKAYFTFDASYMQALWGVLKKVSDDGRLYKDFKVVPWCPHDETALSSHELAQGYEEVKDLTVTAKFKVKNPEQLGLSGNVYLLAWTTTPWTLPGNVALAVLNSTNPLKTADRYVAWHEGDDIFIGSAKYFSGLNRQKDEQINLLDSQDLIGLEYEPLFEELRTHMQSSKLREEEFSNWKNGWKVYPADFVTTEDGTGIVHIASMYGQEDFEVASKENLPKLHTVDQTGHFISNLTPEFLWGRYIKEQNQDGKPTVDVDIIGALKEKRFFFQQENYKHEYPFCWRCKTRLIYYARDSWYIRMQDLRDTLVAENKKIDWVPEYIREGRMGEWLSNVKDWAISRERYWGTPLPVWQSEDGKEQIVIGSIDQLKKHVKKSGNKYFLMRHGEAENNAQNILNADPKKEFHLTEKGKEQAGSVAEKLHAKKIDAIYSSPYLRAKETAAIVAEEIGLDPKNIIVDERLAELGFGDFDGRPFAEYLAFEEKELRTYDTKIPGGESYQDAKNRFGAFIAEIENRQKNQNILIVAHGIELEVAPAVAEAADKVRSKEIIDAHTPLPAELLELDFVPLPHNTDYELDLHRPYIDDVVLIGDSGKELHRVVEVMDVWFDSGAMPFAQDPEHVVYPADFISEAIDQTRGWFYTLLAVGTLMGKGTPYKNAISLGHLLDAEGKKMSKSKGNVVESFAEIERWGADTLRFWMYSVNQPGDSKNYDEKTVREAARVLAWFENSAKFYELFKDEPKSDGEETILDRWMQARLAETIQTVTASMEKYDLYSATRAIALLSEDLSQWYVRRIRDRVRSGDSAALETLRFTLDVSARLLAPFAPFLAEHIYGIAKREEDLESVHLASWPEGDAPEASLLDSMQEVRRYVSLALEAREKAGIKIRQPLGSMAVNKKFSEELLELLKEEINVKAIACNESQEETVVLDTEITAELREEGELREFSRAFQDARKRAGLNAGELAELTIDADSDIVEFIKRHEVTLSKAISLQAIHFAAVEDTEVKIGERKLRFTISR